MRKNADFVGMLFNFSRLFCKNCLCEQLHRVFSLPAVFDGICLRECTSCGDRRVIHEFKFNLELVNADMDRECEICGSRLVKGSRGQVLCKNRCWNLPPRDRADDTLTYYYGVGQSMLV